MSTLLIIGKTLGILFFLGLDFLLFIAFAQSDILGTRGPTFSQWAVLLGLIACAVGIWFL